MLIIFILFFLSIILSSFTTIPILISLLVVCAVVFRKSWVFFAAFLLGLIIDLFQLRLLGQTALFFVIFVFLLFLYERKFETRTLAFVFIATFSGSIIYLLTFGYSNVLIQSLASSLLAALTFKIIQNSTGSIAQLTD